MECREKEKQLIWLSTYNKITLVFTWKILWHKLKKTNTKKKHLTVEKCRTTRQGRISTAKCCTNERLRHCPIKLGPLLDYDRAGLSVLSIWRRLTPPPIISWHLEHYDFVHTLSVSQLIRGRMNITVKEFTRVQVLFCFDQLSFFSLFCTVPPSCAPL